MNFMIWFLAFLLLLSVAIEIKTQSDDETEWNMDGQNVTLDLTTDLPTTSFINSSVQTSCGSSNGSCPAILTQTTTKATQTATTTSPKNVTTPIPKINGSITSTRISGSCWCDLQSNYCDINCCCDKSCSYEDKAVFEHCNNGTKAKEPLPLCNSTPYEDTYNSRWWIFNNKILCINKVNLPDDNSQTIRKMKNLVEEVEGLKSCNTDADQFCWPHVNEDVRNQIKSHNFSEKLKYGGVVWTFKNNEIIPFYVPTFFITNACIAKSHVRYLVDFKTKCSLTSVDNDNQNLYPETYYKKLTFISSSKAFTRLWDRKKQTNCPKNVCISPEVLFCDEHNYTKCFKKINKKANCTYSFHENLTSCKNVVKKVKYDVYHKGREGIMRVIMRITLSNFSYTIEAIPPQFSQEFEVNFHWANHKVNYSSIFSGNPGYIVDKPILITRLNGTYNTSSELYSLNMSSLINKNDSSSFLENFLVFPSFKYKKCILNEGNYAQVEFGYNAILKCRIDEEVVLKSRNKSATEICRLIQANNLMYWSVTDKNSTTVLGKYGNSDRTRITDWLKIYYVQNYTTIINETYGNFTKNNKTLICSKMASKLSIEFFYSHVDFDLENQNILVGVLYNFTGIRNNLEFFIWNATKVNVIVPIKTEIVFHDVTPKNNVERNFEASLAYFDLNLTDEFLYSFGITKNKDNKCSKSTEFHVLQVILSCILWTVM